MPVKELDKITVAELFKEIKDEETLWGDLTETARILLRRLLEGGTEQEIRNHLQCSSYERTKGRLGWRNGYYRRFLETGFGALPLSVPRCRMPSGFSWGKSSERTLSLISVMWTMTLATFLLRSFKVL